MTSLPGLSDTGHASKWTPGYCGMGYGFKKGARFGDTTSLDDEDIRDICANVMIDEFTGLPKYLDGVSAKTGLKVPDEFK
jgi:hypothetical protein